MAEQYRARATGSTRRLSSSGSGSEDWNSIFYHGLHGHTDQFLKSIKVLLSDILIRVIRVFRGQKSDLTAVDRGRDILP